MTQSPNPIHQPEWQQLVALAQAEFAFPDQDFDGSPNIPAWAALVHKLATQPPSPPAQVGTSGASAEVSRLAEALLMDAKDSVEDYRDGKEFGAHDRKLIGRLKAALAAMAYPAAKVGTEDADAQVTKEMGTARESDQQLMRFYSVETIPALIDAQERHIAKLQAKQPPLRDEFTPTPRIA